MLDIIEGIVIEALDACLTALCIVASASYGVPRREIADRIVRRQM